MSNTEKLPSVIVNLVIGYVLKLLSQGVQSIDWTKVTNVVEADLDKYLPAWLQSSANDLVTRGVAVVQAALTDEADLKSVVEDLANADYAGALAAVEALVAKAVAAA